MNSNKIINRYLQMGSSNSSAKRNQKKLVDEYEEKLYVAWMEIDFDAGPNQIVSFNEKFRSENTNEIGQVLSKESAEIIIKEFRKFLFLCGVELTQIRLKLKR